MTLVAGAVVVAVGGVSGPAFAGTTHTELTDTAIANNPCNGENATITGPMDIGYQENAVGGGTRYVVHVNFKGTGSGDQENSYRLSFIANGQFDAPSGTSPGGTPPALSRIRVPAVREHARGAGDGLVG